MKELEKMTDEEIVVLAQQGDGGATEFLLNRYKNLVRTKANSFFISGGESEDLVQEGMIGLYKAIRDYREDKNVCFSAFAVLCIRRQIITALKSATRMKHIPLNSYVSLNKAIYDDESERTLMDVLDAEDSSYNPEEVFMSNEDESNMRAEMKKVLSKLEMEVLDLYLAGRSYQEIACIIDREVKSVDNALQRIKRKVEKQVANSRKNVG